MTKKEYTDAELRELQIAYREQKQNAVRRMKSNTYLTGWKLSFDEWLDIWEKSGRLSQRGKGAGKYCMSRKNDHGAYEVGNVQIQTISDNAREAQLTKSDKRAKGLLRDLQALKKEKQAE